MAPRGRSKPGTSRMDAAVDAMKPFGFDKKVVTSKMRQLVKTYNGHYGFIESDAYLVLLEALLEDKEKEKCEKEIVCGETSEMNEIVECLQVEESNAIVPTVGLVDIPSPPPSPLSFDGFLPSLPPAQETPPPPSPPPCLPTLPPVLDAGPPLPPATLAMYALPPPPGFAHQYTRKRKPCYGWITEEDEEPQFIQLPSSREDFTTKTKMKAGLKPEEM